ncbi:MAG: Uma2 family endonuclease [Planctomycetales bacterium]|nr:Uma2 family endonuclease [Planctomycetales bacterium]
MATVETLLTLEEFAGLPDDGVPRELVRGRIVEMNVPTPRHGEVCATIVELLRRSLREAGRGRIISNDSGLITSRDPDTVRGPDVSFYSFARVPRGPMPEGYLSVVPEVVFEVLSQHDRWGDLLEKTGEYLKAGVEVVCVLNPRERTIHVFHADTAVDCLGEDDEFSLPRFFGDFSVAAAGFFD